MWYDHRPNEVIEDLDFSLVSSAVLTFTLMLASFTFQMAAAAPGITSRCRNNRDGKTSTLLVCSPVRKSFPETPHWPPLRSPFPALSQTSTLKPKTRRGNGNTLTGLLTKIYFWAGSGVGFLWVLTTWIKQGFCEQGGRREWLLGRYPSVPPTDTRLVFLLSLAQLFGPFKIL